jgi:hypothetical protein
MAQNNRMGEDRDVIRTAWGGRSIGTIGRLCFEHFPTVHVVMHPLVFPFNHLGRSRDHKADEDVDVLHLVDDAALGSRMAWCRRFSGSKRTTRRANALGAGDGAER